MDTAIWVALIPAAGAIVVALIAWHANNLKERAARITTAEETARRIRADADASLEAVRQATDQERQRLLELLHTRLEETLNQLGSARQSLARARKENVALRSENEELRREPRGEHHGQGGLT